MNAGNTYLCRNRAPEQLERSRIIKASAAKSYCYPAEDYMKSFADTPPRTLNQAPIIHDEYIRFR
jgi:hypothetical protein